MKKFRLFALALTALVLAFNICTRANGPVIGLDVVLGDFAYNYIFNSGLSFFLTPGAYPLWYLGVDLHTPTELLADLIISWWAWLTCARVIWCAVGRAFGIGNTAADFHRWITLAVPWRPFYRVWLRIWIWFKQFRYGTQATAAWTGFLSAMTLTFKRGDYIYLGRLWGFGKGFFQTLGVRGPRNVNVIAAPGSGKTRWLMAWLGMIHRMASALVVDCDGQIINALGAGLERAGHRVLNLDPYRLTKFPGACWNALDELGRCAKRHGIEAVVRFAQTLAEALIREDNSHQPIFANAAREFLLGLILYVWLFAEEHERNLVTVRDWLTRGRLEFAVSGKMDGFRGMLGHMSQAPYLIDDGCGGKITTIIARAASVMQSAQRGNEGDPFRSTAIAQTAFLDLPEIAAISRRSDFACEDLKTSNPCVFICAPVTDIQTKLSGWVRALTMMTAYAFQNMPGDRLGKVPCVFMIDEAPSLGRIEIFETASAVFRHFGIRLVLIMQDLGQLKQVYPGSWESLIANAQVNIWMSTVHQFNLEYLGKLLGTFTQIVKVTSGLLSKVPPRLDKKEQPLMHAHQLAEFLAPERRQIIVTRAGGPPIRVAYDGYDTALPVSDYEADESYQEPRLRAFTRRVRTWLRPPKPPLGPMAGTAN